MPTARINLGLDLAGGSHLLLEADTSDVAKQRIALMEETVRTEMRRASPRIQIGDISNAGGRVHIMVSDPSRVAAAVDIMRALPQPDGRGVRKSVGEGKRRWVGGDLGG